MSSGIAQSSTKDDYNPDEDYEVVHETRLRRVILFFSRIQQMKKIWIKMSNS